MSNEIFAGGQDRVLGALVPSSFGKKTYKLSDDVWMAAVQVFQLAMFTNQDVSDVFQGLDVVETDDGRLDLTEESKRTLASKIDSFALPTSTPPELEEDEPVFVIGKD